MLASTVLTELHPSPEMTLSLVKYRKLEIKSLQADVFKSSVAYTVIRPNHWK